MEFLNQWINCEYPPKKQKSIAMKSNVNGHLAYKSCPSSVAFRKL